MQTFSCDKTRECRANNPFGMSKGPLYDGINLTESIANKYTGLSIAGVDNEVGDMLQIFDTWQDGMNAAFWRLYAVYFKVGISTPRAIYNKWSGDTEKKALARNEKSNGLKVAEIMGVNPDKVLSFTITDLLPLCQAMLRFEDTTEVLKEDLVKIPIEMYQIAIDYAHKREDNVVPLNGNKNGGVAWLIPLIMQLFRLLLKRR